MAFDKKKFWKVLKLQIKGLGAGAKYGYVSQDKAVKRKLQELKSFG